MRIGAVLPVHYPLDGGALTMTQSDALSVIAAEFRRHFDQYYLGVIPRLLNEEGKFLAFVTTLTAIESLASVYDPSAGSGQRFREFVSRYFPEIYGPVARSLWKFRNRMIHSFNPSPFLIVCHSSRMHLQAASGTPMLNAEDFYADTVAASRKYFGELYVNPKLQESFAKSIAEDEIGHIHTSQITEAVHRNEPAV